MSSLEEKIRKADWSTFSDKYKIQIGEMGFQVNENGTITYQPTRIQKPELEIRGDIRKALQDGWVKAYQEGNIQLKGKLPIFLLFAKVMS